MYIKLTKPFLDHFIGIVFFLIMLPVLAIACVLIKVESKGPIFFRQNRLGKHGKVFSILKLRTMTHKTRIADREILSGDPEVTKVGGILRRLKIDEIPQIINVIKGDMSLIGPRPCLPEQIHELSEIGRYRLKVLPGLTGLAQVNGNIHLSWPERWVYDKEYVEHLSFKLDVFILIKTVLILLRGEDKYINRKHYAEDRNDR